MKLTLKHSVGASAGALLTSSATLVCCVLPAVMVSLGAGATLASLVTALPQLVWLSEHKVLVFGIAGSALLVSGIMLRRAQQLPCPTDPSAARLCTRLRQLSWVLYSIAVVAFAVGTVFAVVVPALD